MGVWLLLVCRALFQRAEQYADRRAHRAGRPGRRGGLQLPAKRYLMPLSYITILAGCCTLVGTSTNLLVDDMARIAGQRRFGIFEITPVGVPVAAVGGFITAIQRPIDARRGRGTEADGRYVRLSRLRAGRSARRGVLDRSSVVARQGCHRARDVRRRDRARRPRRRADRRNGICRRGVADLATRHHRRSGLWRASSGDPYSHRWHGRDRDRDGAERARRCRHAPAYFHRHGRQSDCSPPCSMS